MWAGSRLGFLKPCSTALHAGISSAFLTKFPRELWKDVAVCPGPQQKHWKTSHPYMTACILHRPILGEMKLNPCAKPWLPTQPPSANSVIYFVTCLRQFYLHSYHSLTPSPWCPRARHGAAVTAMPSTQEP